MQRLSPSAAFFVSAVLWEWGLGLGTGGKEERKFAQDSPVLVLLLEHFSAHALAFQALLQASRQSSTFMEHPAVLATFPIAAAFGVHLAPAEGGGGGGGQALLQRSSHILFSCVSK